MILSRNLGYAKSRSVSTLSAVDGVMGIRERLVYIWTFRLHLVSSILEGVHSWMGIKCLILYKPCVLDGETILFLVVHIHISECYYLVTVSEPKLVEAALAHLSAPGQGIFRS
ncbi:Hypothetical predicted protein [Olea europaea subsp. europaea]|uniref:Uncharacterized protein n=1 Tax=Olea europaea subsp. europaea TaxID=158383 RepID=A0A8S0QSX9_OLEEU|nr:Hypothetical predicted protein [Olea europaea subsp. europaea]